MEDLKMIYKNEFSVAGTAYEIYLSELLGGVIFQKIKILIVFKKNK
jgi:hypothetical protein